MTVVCAILCLVGISAAMILVGELTCHIPYEADNRNIITLCMLLQDHSISMSA